MPGEFIARNGIISRGNVIVTGSLTTSGSLTTTGTITATTLVVQTITSSISSITGSTNFGTLLANTHTFTGSLNVTGALAVTTTGTELQVTNTGVRIGNVSTDVHPITGSVNVSGSATFVSSITANGGFMSLGDDGTYGSTYKTLGLTGTTNGSHRILAGTADDIYIAAATARGIYFWTNGATTTRMRILANGAVGIGTSSPSDIYSLTLNGDSSTRTGGIVFRQSGVDTFYMANPSVTNTTDFELWNPQAGYLRFATSNVERMRITSAGNVGIGTTSPVTFGTINLDVNAGSGGSAYIVVRNSSNAQTIELAMDGGVGYLSTKSNHPLRIRTNDASRIIVTSIASGGWFKAANDGTFINTNGNYHELTSNRANDNVVYMSNTSGTPYGPFIWFVNATPNNTTSYFLAGTDSVNDKFIIYSNGTYGSRTGTYGSIISDEKYKQDITDANSQWDDIKNLKVRNFRYKEDVQNEGDNALRQIGFIAQEVEQVSPGLVYEAGKKDSDETWKSVKTSIIEIKAIKALQEAMAKIEALEARIQELENK